MPDTETREATWRRLLVLLILLWASIQRGDAQESTHDRVTYTSFRPGNWEIYLFEQAGQPPKRLTTDPGLDYDPKISPDGRWLVFCSERRGDPDLFVLDLAHEGDPRLLIESEAMEDQAAFTSDGKAIAFVSTASGNADIYVIPFRPEKTTSINEARNVTQSNSGEFRPAFSPDGRKLAFSSDRDGGVLVISPIVRLRHGDIYVLDLAEKQVSRLTDAPGWDGSPAWSADGSMIVFYRGDVRTAASWRESHTQIWVMNSDGTNQRVLTPDESNALSPEFMPDGRIIYSAKESSGNWQLASIDLSGHNKRLESVTSNADYWEPSRAGSQGAVVAHGNVPSDRSSSNSPNSRVGGPDLGDGPFIAGGGPVSRKLSDREIDLYAIRYFSVIIHPTQDIALLLVPPGPSDISLSRLDGTDRRKIFEFGQEGGAFSSASWSRDGAWIALTRGLARRLDGEADVWKISADGSQIKNLTAGIAGNQSFPSFAADGREIVFRGEHEGRFGLYLMSADGDRVRPIASDVADAIFPVFSPVARQIAFLSNRDNPGVPLYEVYLLDLDPDDTPTSMRRITSNDVQEGHIAFSYDGQWLIFSSEVTGVSDEEPLVQSVIFAPQMYGEMYAYRISDGQMTRLTHNKWEEGVPSWEAAVR